MANVTLPDPPPAVVYPGQAPVKTWRLKNTGTSIWGNGYKLVFRYGDRLGTPESINVPTTRKDQTADLSVQLQIPGNIAPSNYKGYWQLRNSQGTYFGPEIWYSVQVPSPQPVTGNGVDIAVEEINSPSQVSPGQRFRPTVRVKVKSGQLICCQGRGDMLRIYNSTNYTDGQFPHVTVQGTINTGQTFTFQFYEDHPFVAPNEPGSYDSVWRVWANNGWVGPEIHISFNVYTGSTGRAPNAPSLVSPHDWYQYVGSTAQLCARDNGDADGDAITAYHFVAWNSVSPTYDSGWVPGPCVTANNLQYQGYAWHVQVRDSRNQVSDWSPEWHFGMQSPSSTFTDIHFDPGSPSNANSVICYSCASGCTTELSTWVNTATDGSANGEWKEIGTLGIPCFTFNDAPRWDTTDYADGTHLVRFRAKGCDGSITVQDRTYNLTRRKPSRPFLQSPSDQFWSNTRTVTFSWQAAMRATGYRLVAGTSQNLSQNLVLNVPVNGTSYTYTFSQDYPRLYWGVYADNELGSTDQLGRWLGIDPTAPVSSIDTSLTSSLVFEPQFAVAWSGSDAPSNTNSGVQSYDVQVKQDATGQWTDWLLNYPHTSAIFSGQPGHTYYFRTRAHDIAGNVEAYPNTPDAHVQVDPSQRPPQAWWNTSYQYKRTLILNNPMSNVTLPTGYVVRLHFDSSTSPTASEIYNGSLASTKGNDVRVLYNDQTQLPRHVQTFTSTAIDIWFTAQAPINPSSASSAYQLYYGNPSPDAPPMNLGDVFLPHSDGQTVASWYYEDGAGTADSTGLNHNLTWRSSGAVGQSYGLHGQGVRMTGANNAIAMSGQPVGNLLTAETWARFEGIGTPISVYLPILSKPSSADHRDRWAIRLQDCSGRPCIRAAVEVFNPNSYTFGLEWPGPVQADTWYHFAITYDGTTARLWVNGQVVESKSAAAGRIRDEGEPISIGPY
ncbi:MAG TPA: NBR1-Ig-like domain-containing protein [Chloroflexia bacterium]